MSSYNDARRSRVMSVLKALKPFSEDGGESGKALQAFDFDDWQIVHGVMNPWLELRPGVGGKQYGYEAVRLPGDTRVSIIAPDGKLYATLHNC